MNIWLRTAKISISATLAILISEWLGLSYSTAAGVIAILSVLDTNKSSITTVLQRIGSTILALIIGVIVFNLIGFELWTFGVYLAIYVPLAYYFNVQVGLGPCSVLVSHLLLEQSTSPEWIINELLLMLIGGGIAVIFNLYMPSHEKEMRANKDKVEDLMRQVLYYFERSLRYQPNRDEADELFGKLYGALDASRQLALEESDNKVGQSNEYGLEYIEMRHEQANVLRQINGLINRIDVSASQSQKMATFINEIANQLHEMNPVIDLTIAIAELYDEFRKSELPKDRYEFENRALLFTLLNYFSEFLKIKRNFYAQHEDDLKIVTNKERGA